MITPIMSDTFNINVNNCVIFPLLSLVNQLADIFPWQFRIKGLPMPAKICPIITKTKD